MEGVNRGVTGVCLSRVSAVRFGEVRGAAITRKKEGEEMGRERERERHTRDMLYAALYILK